MAIRVISIFHISATVVPALSATTREKKQKSSAAQPVHRCPCLSRRSRRRVPMPSVITRCKFSSPMATRQGSSASSIFASYAPAPNVRTNSDLSRLHDFCRLRRWFSMKVHVLSEFLISVYQVGCEGWSPARCDTLPMIDTLEAQEKGNRPRRRLVLTTGRGNREQNRARFVNLVKYLPHENYVHGQIAEKSQEGRMDLCGLA